MVLIFAEKEDMAAKMAGALDCVRLASGKTYQFKDIEKNSDAIKRELRKMSHLEVTHNGQKMMVTWAQGHLCGLKHAKDYNPDYKYWSKLPVPFIPKRFELKANEGKEARIGAIRKLFSRASLIVNATDNDREGDVIFGYIYELCGCSTPYVRARFNEVTKNGLIAGLDRKNLIPAADAKPMEMAGRARAVADWLVGANLTAQMTLKHTQAGSKQLLSIGRVQTPVLQMMVEKEIAIRNFKSAPFWVVEALFTTAAGEEFKAVHTSEQIDDEAAAKALTASLAGHKGTVAKIRNRDYEKKPPALYSLATLQMDANTIYGLTLTETLSCAQKLYEGGYTTYPRSDSAFLADDMEPTVKDVLNALETLPAYTPYLAGKPRMFRSKKDYFNSKKVSSHHAIIPTTSVPSSLSGNQAKVYDLIAKSLIRIIYPPAKGKLVKAHIDVNGEGFTANGSTVVDKGWLEVGGSTKEKFLPTLNVGEALDGTYESREGKTTPPKAYTDASLVAAMASAGQDLPDAELRKIMSDPQSGGIGRPSTRNTIPETLIDRGYVVRKGKTLRATDLAITLIDIMPCAELKSPEMTARWESRLNKIAEKADTYDAFVADIIDATGKWCADITGQASSGLGASCGPGAPGPSSSGSLVCPLCGAEVRRYNWGWGCTGYKSGCKFSINAKIAGKKLTDKQAEDLVAKGKTSVIKGFTGSKGKFDARLAYNKATQKIDFAFERKKKSQGNNGGNAEG